MKAWLREHVLALADGLLRLRRQFVAAILNVLVIGVAMSLPVGLYVVLNNVAGLVQRSASEPQMTLFLDVDVPAADREAIRERLARAVGRGRFEFIPKDQALEGLRRTAGLSDVVEELGQNPLPDAFVVTGRADDAAGLESLRAEAEKWPGVEHAQLDSVWARQVEAGLRLGKAFVGMLGVILGVALVAVTFNTIRLQILARQEEIEVSKLIGATNAFIRRPFLYFGVLQGVLGALFAWGLVAVALGILEREIGIAMTLVSDTGELQGLAFIELISVTAVAALLGWLGAWISVGLHLRRLDPS